VSSRNDFEQNFNSSCYSYIKDVTEFYWGYPGSIDEDELVSKWGTLFNLNYASFGHAFENGNCGCLSIFISSYSFFSYGAVNERCSIFLFQNKETHIKNLPSLILLISCAFITLLSIQ
jgi:hypothetical protein